MNLLTKFGINKLMQSFLINLTMSTRIKIFALLKMGIKIVSRLA